MFLLKLSNSESWVSDSGYTFLKDTAKTFKSINIAIKGKNKWMKEHGQVYVSRAIKNGRNFDLEIVEELEREDEN